MSILATHVLTVARVAPVARAGVFDRPNRGHQSHRRKCGGFG